MGIKHNVVMINAWPRCLFGECFFRIPPPSQLRRQFQKIGDDSATSILYSIHPIYLGIFGYPLVTSKSRLGLSGRTVRVERASAVMLLA
jgi:hypothetical protein